MIVASKSNAKGRSRTASFVALPKHLINSPKYQRLNGNSVKLLTQIAEQFNGSNNGDLQAAFSILKGKGWKSSETLDRALKELLTIGLIVKTRQGYFPNTCSLFGLTWHLIDKSDKYDDRSLIGKIPGGWRN
jgi:alkylhydroperoxidase/carboxymuconolactone decarboxylase family protein YurZ